jgi:hypothetical protein
MPQTPKQTRQNCWWEHAHPFTSDVNSQAWQRSNSMVLLLRKHLA